MRISAFLPVYNEEVRILYALKSLLWCDEIVVLDKNSTDKTKEIALGFSEKVKVVTMENSVSYDSNEWEVFLNNCSFEWTILFTASDLIHPKLAKRILSMIRTPDLPYDILDIPFKRYVLGLNDKRSPWYSKVSSKVMRTSSIILDLNNVHNVASFSGRKYTFNDVDEYCMYHLTHVNVDKMMNNHIRYWKGEAKSTKNTLRNSALLNFKEFCRLVFYKKTFILGYDGLMLSFAYLSYYMMSFVYTWEAKRGRGEENYSKIRDLIEKEWDKEI